MVTIHGKTHAALTLRSFSCRCLCWLQSLGRETFDPRWIQTTPSMALQENVWSKHVQHALNLGYIYLLVMTNIAIEHGQRKSDFYHWNWWFSIVMLVYQRIYILVSCKLIGSLECLHVSAKARRVASYKTRIMTSRNHPAVHRPLTIKVTCANWCNIEADL